MTWLTLAWALTLGTFNQNGIIQKAGLDMVYQTPPNSYVATLEGRATFFDHIFLAGSVETDMTKGAEGVSFNPFESTYRAQVGLVFGPVEIGYDHTCIHPTLSALALPEVMHGGNTDSFYIKIFGKTSF